MDKLKALLEQFDLDNYLGDLMTMGVFSIDDLCTLNDKEILDIVGTKGNPDYLALSNLIATVNRRYKIRNSTDKEEEEPSIEKVVKKSANKTAKPSSVSEYSAEKDIFGLGAIALGIVLLIAGYVKEGLYFNDMLFYFIGFMIATLVGLYLIKPEYFSYKPSLLFIGSLTLFSFSLFFLLCESSYKGDITYFDINYASTGSIVCTTITMLISFASAYNLLNKTASKNDDNNAPNKTNNTEGEKEETSSQRILEDKQGTTKAKETESASNKDVENEELLTKSTSSETINISTVKEEPNITPTNKNELPDRIRWGTMINGKTFRFAWIVSYISLPISILLNFVILMSCLSYDDPDLLFVSLTLGSIIFSVITVLGLFVFKHYSYICIQINSVITLIFGMVLLINQTIIYFNYPNISQNQSFSFAILYILTIFLLHGLSLWYFYNRKECFNR